MFQLNSWIPLRSHSSMWAVLVRRAWQPPPEGRGLRTPAMGATGARTAHRHPVRGSSEAHTCPIVPTLRSIHPLISLWSHRISPSYATGLPTSLGCIAPTDQRHLAMETCCGASVRSSQSRWEPTAQRAFCGGSGCNAAKGSRQTGRVTWGDAMAPEADQWVDAP